MWEIQRERNNQGIISVWEKEWRGSPEENGCYKSFIWIPKAWEFSCTAYPWAVMAEMNDFPECLDAYMAHPLEPLVIRLEAAAGKPYVDKGNLTQMVNHREWLPHELWLQAKRTPKGSTVYIERENCFNLKKHTRGKPYWTIETKTPDVFQRAEYWCGELGYRPGPDGIGYRDFPIHQIKVNYILSMKPRGKVLDIGCAMGYIVARLRKAGVDA
ncbi:unnamed protein product [marine sediment metagenome]|uniref:Uncharacterized protein n=1 Tax=marine sediment metagenome TaxID=412755 RepID=X1Q3E4_9ZZZZ